MIELKQIPNIDNAIIIVRNLDVPQIHNVITEPPRVLPPLQPVTMGGAIGVPIVDMPGCVETHKSNNGNKNLSEDDENGVVTHCDAGVPSYNTINYQPEQLTYTKDAPVDTRTKPKPPESPPLPEAPEIPETPVPKEDCPAADILSENPPGTVVEAKTAGGGKREITGYEWQGNPKVCVTLYREVGIVDQVRMAIPTAGAVTTTGGIAVVATTSALLAKPLADLLLKVVKPVTKKVVKKISAIRGKKVKVESRRERILAQRDRNLALLTLKKALKK